MQEKNNAVVSTENVKRRHTDAQERRLYVDKWKQSNLTMTEYCRQQGLALSSFSAWVQACAKAKPTFKAVAVDKTVPTQYTSSANTVEMIVDNRIKIRFVNITDPLLLVAIANGLAKCS